MAAFDQFSPLGIGVVGLGRAGTYHAERIGLRTDCRIVAAYDDCLHAMQKGAGLAERCAKTWGDLLSDDRVELVLVATPPATHPALVMEALAAGKHLLVETPLALDLPSVDALLAASRRAARSIIVAHTRRWESPFLAARRCVAGGALGRLRLVKQIAWQYSPPAGPTRDRAAAEAATSPHHFAPHDWRDHGSTGGGALWEFGVHAFDQLVQLVGERPLRVNAELYSGLRAGDPEDGFLALVHFPSGLRAQLEVHRASPASVQTGWIVVGSEGSFSDGTLLSVSSDGEVIDQPLPGMTGDADELYASVVRHLRAGGPNPVPPEEARLSIALVDAVSRAARTGRPAQIDD